MAPVSGSCVSWTLGNDERCMSVVGENIFNISQQSVDKRAAADNIIHSKCRIEQLCKGPITIAIRLRLDCDSTAIRLHQ